MCSMNLQNYCPQHSNLTVIIPYLPTKSIINCHFSILKKITCKWPDDLKKANCRQFVLFLKEDTIKEPENIN